ncbi:hypothetical protein HU200_051945 [Digitaria exilis]|uniref:F-box domain-containing protein n=1 Tax=Digitaria exilis TaxID=1010633 RepID=A0A835AS72_9POAL|nr:hypothetical protein HU200_051945 [Digitaria exilis]
MLERVLARLPPASYFRLRGVSRRWRAAADSTTFRAACARAPPRDPWFLMLQDSANQDPAVVYDSGERAWARWRGSPEPTPVAAAGGLVLYRDPATGELTVVNPLTGASRPLPSPPAAADALQAVAMFGSPAYRVVLILGELPKLSMATFDSTTNAWEDVVPLSRKTYTSAVVTANGEDAAAAVAYFLSRSGTVVACDMARRAFAELPRILPAYHEYSIDVVACGGAAYAVVLSEFLDTASLRVWELDAGGAWRQVAAMPPAMSHAFRGAKADVNCVGHADRVMVCVSSGDVAGARGCFVCDVRTNRWEELTCCADGDGEEATCFVAALSFEPRMEAAV